MPLSDPRLAILAHAEGYGEALAVDGPDQGLTYAQLAARSAAVANRLLACSPEALSGQPVAILAPRGAAHITALLAVARAGAAFMPIDPQLPMPRMQAMLAQARPQALLHTPALAGLARAVAGAMPLLAVTEEEESRGPLVEVAPNSASYLMFTSGSSGTPKGVLGRWKSLTHFIRWQSDTFALDRTMRTAQLAPVTFDVSLRDILTPLVNGGTVCVPGDEVAANPRLLLRWLAEQRITVLHCVPTIFRLMTEALAAPDMGEAPDLGPLRHIFLAGEPLFGRDIKAWRALAGDGAQLVNLYGPSETTLAKLYHPIADDDTLAEGMVPVGRPLPDTAVLVLKGERLATVGEIGEICIRTAYPSLGYINDPAATRAVFVRNPVGEQENDIIYRSGDMGRTLPDGAIECLGRVDNQVKIAGNRVEGGDVEAAARGCAGVGQCAVIIDRSLVTEPFLIGYFTGDGSEAVDVDTLRTHLNSSLPAYMVPRFLVQLAELPLLMNGKVNRRALPRPEQLIHGDAGPTLPEGEMEQTFARIWSEILGVERVGVETPFANLGGDSLKAIKVIARLHLETGRDIGLANFFTKPTIRAQVQLLRENEAVAEEEIRPLPEAPDYPLSSAQRRLWALHGLGMNPIAYNLTFGFIADRFLDVERLQRAVNAVIDRHEILRTRFPSVHGEPRQQPVSGLRLRIERRSLAGPDPLSVAAEAELAAERQRPFDLSEAPLLRVVAVSSARAEEGSLLIFSFHHIICDGESLSVFAEELALAYGAGGVLELKPLALQHRDLSAWQHQRLKDPARLDRLLRFWKEALGEAPPVLELPEARPRPAVQRFRGDTRQLVLPAALAEGLRHLASQEQTTLFNLLLTGLLLVLERHSGQQEMVVGTPVLGRGHHLLHQQIGFFANTLALRNRVDHGETVAQLIARVSARTKEALDHQELPFEQLVQHFDLPRNLARNPICDVLLVVLDTPSTTIRLPGVGIQPFGNDSEWKFSRCDLVVQARTDNDAGELCLDLNYDSDLFTAAQVDRLAQHMANVLARMCETPQRAVAEVCCLTAAELALIASLDRTAEAGPATTICRMFARVVAQHRERVAVKEAGRALSYGQLDSLAHDVAAELLRQGGAPEERVAVIGARTVEGVAAMLGIMRAGGAYVAIDERWPQARIAQVLTSSGACRLLLAAEAAPPLPPGVELLRVRDIGHDPGAAIDYARPDSLAYIIFTSGSTGEPKGVMVEHGGFCNMIGQQIEAFAVTPASRVLQFAAPAFDGALSEIFMALLCGAQLVLTRQEVIENLAAFQALLAAEAITTVTLPPSYLAALPGTLPDSVETVITAGEAARPADAGRYAHQLRFINAYGPAENSVCSTLHRICAADAQGPAMPLGRPLAGVGIALLDRSGRPVPIGVPGEMVLSGAGLARGYCGRPDLTGQAFFTDPARNGRRHYRSGDFCALNEDGALTYGGRRDGQVKIAGQRLELGDVEQVLRQAPGVEEAVVGVLGDADQPGGVGAWVKRRPLTASLWPSVAEFFVYDDIVYGAMASDNIRNSRYLEGFRRYLPGALVMEVGPGPFAILSRLAIEAGARHVYAVEINPEVAEQARRCIAGHRLSERITVITGDAVEVVLPERVDWCISEIVGGIGGSEGAAAIINAIRPRLAAPANLLPRASVTKIAAVEFPASALDAGFSPLAHGYVRRIFAQVGRPFDLRLCLRNFDRNAILSSAAIFEALDFTHEMSLESSHAIELTVLRAGRVTGFLLWLTMDVGANREIDIVSGSCSWLPVYVAFDLEGVEVARGDRFLGRVQRLLGRGGRHQDYRMEGELHTARGGCQPIFVDIPHASDGFRQTPLHRHLFRADGTARLVEDDFVEGVRAHAAAHLPRYAAPRLIREIEMVPLTVNGKIAHDELPTLVQPVRAAVAGGGPAPMGETARAIASVFRQLLGVDEVAADTSFFAGGGDSIAAIRAVARLGDLGIGLTVAEIFQHQTVAELARVARDIDGAGYNTPYSGEFPLAPIQQWFIHRHGLGPGHHFNQSVLLGLSGPFESDVIREALDRLLAQHDILRGHLLATVTPPQFTVPAGVAASILTVHDLRGVGRLAADGEALRLANAAHRGFDLASGPLLAALLFRRDDGDRLLLLAHHLVVDVVSWRILLTDLRMLLSDPARELPARTAPYGEIVAALAREAVAPVTTTEMPYWREVVQHITACPLPKAENGDSRVTLHRLDLGPEETTALVAAAGKAPGALQASLLRAIAAAAAEAFGWPGAPIAVETNGRELPATIPPCGRTVGWFTQVVPVWVAAEQGGDPMAEIPRRGVGHGLLAWLRDDHPELRTAVAPISFNFLGRLGGARGDAAAAEAPFVVDWDGLGEPIPPEMAATHAIDILAHFQGEGMFVSVTIDHGAMATAAATTFIEVLGSQLRNTTGSDSGVAGDIDMEALASLLGV